MNRLWPILLLLLGALPAPAQTNVTTATLPTARGPTLISARTGDFDLNAREAVYRGHVRVDDPQMQLTCEQLSADMPQEGGHVSHIVAETNVVIDFMDNKGLTNRATGDKAVYIYSVQGGVTNETVTLTGDPQPQMEDGQGNTIVGDVIVWDRLSNHWTASNFKIIYRHSLINSPAATNAAPANPPPGTNQPGAPPAR